MSDTTPSLGALDIDITARTLDELTSIPLASAVDIAVSQRDTLRTAMHGASRAARLIYEWAMDDAGDQLDMDDPIDRTVRGELGSADDALRARSAQYERELKKIQRALCDLLTTPGMTTEQVSDLYDDVCILSAEALLARREA